ncbi:MAG: hypothetical protein HeimC2_36600 [Candidatus Heimdallarchaeota archaeon LC_2]|nr:MAG: hypothetical protein HeimC2_36600 [Candidatus Heimdallarchaeota archaeon LC_2]
MPAGVIVITGTPGTGKTTVTSILQEKGYFTINLEIFAKKYNCIAGYDDIRQSTIIDTEKLQDTLQNYLTAGRGIVIIEGHYADIVPEEFVLKCFVLSCPIEDLRPRLEIRGYPQPKIDENIQAEIMKVCWTDALDLYGPSKVTKIDNMPINDIANLIDTFGHIARNRERLSRESKI